jgi:1-deoxy-D-xylulose-5-phosphate synthase
MTLLEKIKTPADLKALPARDLPALAAEIRQLIVSTVTTNGGHMASNLGVVELTIALHRVFNSPHDKLIFDVSHQSYPHKILTGRAEGFASIRTTGGYSGYFDHRESPHDLLTLGHAGCAPSLALGVALGEKMKGGDGYIVCIVGDGGLTSGLAYEGLSNIIAQNPKNLMVILNDNGMAISPNVGWLANWRGNWLPHLRDQLELDTDFQKFEQISESLATKIPFGPPILDLGKGIKSAIQRSLIPEIGHVWDEMGFNYLGPVDGHNIEDVITVLEKARQNSDKVPFIHILTNKGQGHKPAKADPVHYHQPGPPAQGRTHPTYSKVFTACLGDLMEKDKDIVAISAAMLEGTGLSALQADFPGRIIDVGICEQHAVSMAAGMARAGLKPVVCIYSTFLQRSFDQIMHDVCMNDLHVVFAMDRAGIVGQDGMTHHGLYDLAYMRIIPNMVVAVPRDENQMCHLLYTALHQEHPFSLRFPRGEVQGLKADEELKFLGIGRAEWVRDCLSNLPPRDKVCLAAVGEQVSTALQAAEELEEAGISVEVVDVRFVKPIDPKLVDALVDEYNNVVVIEEGTSVGGLASALMEAVALRRQRLIRLHHLAAGDIFLDHGEIRELRKLVGLDVQAVVEKVKSIIRGGE